LEPGSAFTASMLRDSQAGLKTEHEHILGAMTARAKQLDVDVPLIEAAYIALAIKAN
jgi:2-dehydropantoate 2-reductase